MRHFWSRLASLDWLFPPRCVSCRSFLREHRGLCGPCETLWPSLPPAHCPRCARPFESAKSGEHLCGDCLSDGFHCEKVRAAGSYVGLLHDLILKLKYQGQEALAPFLGDRLSLVLSGAASDWDLILPIPLHRKRLRERGYNQSLLIARRLARRIQVPVDAFVLKKVHETDVQAGLSRVERLKNLRGCFAVTRPERVKGLRILLIDDVFTTGSTLETAARALKKAGAIRVEALVLARAT